MTPLRLITSAAYIDQELSAEFGQIPPSFLPIGNSRLYEAQIALFNAEPIHLTIPESYVPTKHDRERLEGLNVQIVPVPDGLRLGESVLYALNYISAPPGEIQILHGDTLIEDLPDAKSDYIAFSNDGDDYSWAEIEFDEGRITKLQVIPPGSTQGEMRSVACGFFSFTSSAFLTRALTRARGDFITALNIYVQDQKVSGCPVKHWRDFGHIQPYFKSRRAISTTRAFNRMEVSDYIVRKSSRDKDKMAAEINWLRNVPPSLAPYTARLIHSGSDETSTFYETEYQFAPTLSELFVFSTVGRQTWKNILNSCHDFLRLCSTIPGRQTADPVLQDLIVTKTAQRLELYERQSGFETQLPTRFDGKPLPSLQKIAADLAGAIDFRTGRQETIMHGDFCLSNILFNSRAGKIVVIDPRGYVEAGKPSLFGDLRYDLAKLSHSILGCYDHILAGRYALERPGSHEFSLAFESSASQEWLQHALFDFEVDGIRAGDLSVRAATVHLFLSMLPLHNDRPDRQAAFIANALRLYKSIEGGLA